MTGASSCKSNSRRCSYYKHAWRPRRNKKRAEKKQKKAEEERKSKERWYGYSRWYGKSSWYRHKNNRWRHNRQNPQNDDDFDPDVEEWVSACNDGMN